MSDIVTGDPELRAMGHVLDALSALDQATQLRVLHWVATKLDIPLGAEGHFSKVPVREAAQPTPSRAALREGTVSTVAIKLGAESCRTLLIAAAVHLSLYQGKDTFTRAEWLACAKEARPWKADYNTQIPTIINRLLSAETIFEKSKDVYSMAAASLSEQEAKLANG